MSIGAGVTVESQIFQRWLFASLPAAAAWLACLREPRADAALQRLPARRLTKASADRGELDSMLELHAAGNHETEAHAMTGALSSGDAKQAALEPPHLQAWAIGLTRATCCAATGGGCCCESSGRPRGCLRRPACFPQCRHALSSLATCHVCSRPV